MDCGQFLSLSLAFALFYRDRVKMKIRVATLYFKDKQEKMCNHLVSSEFPLLETSSKTDPSALNSLDKREEGRPG